MRHGSRTNPATRCPATSFAAATCLTTTTSSLKPCAAPAICRHPSSTSTWARARALRAGRCGLGPSPRSWEKRRRTIAGLTARPRLRKVLSLTTSFGTTARIRGATASSDARAWKMWARAAGATRLSIRTLWHSLSTRTWAGAAAQAQSSRCGMGTLRSGKTRRRTIAGQPARPPLSTLRSLATGFGTTA